MCPGIKPRKASCHRLHFQLLVFQELLIDGGYLQLSTRRRLDVFRHLNHLVRIEIQADNRIVTLRVLRFLLDAQAVARLIKLCHSVSLRVTHPIAEHRSLPIHFRIQHSLPQQTIESDSMEDVVAKHQAGTIISNELLTDDERLRQSVRRRLLCVLKSHPELAAVSQQTFEARQVIRRRDNKYLPDACKHQHRNRIVNHRFVKDGYQLLADSLGDRVQSCTTTTGENDSLHV